MSASWTGNMRGPRMKTPLLLLLLLAALTGTVFCQDEEGDSPADAPEEEQPEPEPEPAPGTETEPELQPEPEPGLDLDPDPETVAETDIDTDLSADPPPSENTDLDTAVENPEEHSSGDAPYDMTLDPSLTDYTTPQAEDQSLNPIIIMIPVVLVIIIIAMIVGGIFISRRWTKKVGNQELSKEDPYLDGSSTEKVPMPMFEEDVPSVLELEMEELDQWMKKDTETAEDS